MEEISVSRKGRNKTLKTDGTTHPKNEKPKKRRYNHHGLRSARYKTKNGILKR